MPEIRIGRGKVYVNYVGDGRYAVEILGKTGAHAALEMSDKQLDTLGKALQVIAKDKK